MTSSWSGGSDRTAWRVVDATIVVGLAVVVLAVARGTIGTASLDAGTDPLLTVLPVLVVLCGGLLAARLWPVTVTTIGRLLPRRWVGARLGLLGAARRPLRPVATVAFLTAATAVVVFAGSYRSTLAQGAVDQAAYRGADDRAGDHRDHPRAAAGRRDTVGVRRARPARRRLPGGAVRGQRAGVVVGGGAGRAAGRRAVRARQRRLVAARRRRARPADRGGPPGRAVGPGRRRRAGRCATGRPHRERRRGPAAGHRVVAAGRRARRRCRPDADSRAASAPSCRRR